MSSDSLNFTLRIVDQCTSPMKGINKQMETFNKALGSLKTSPALRDIAGGLRKVQGLAGSAMSAVATGAAVAGSALAAVALAATAGAAGIGVLGGKMVLEAEAFKQTTKTSMEAILGSKKAADEFFKTGMDTAQFLGTDATGQIQRMQTLLSKGFSPSEIVRVNAALADMKALDPSANLDSITLAMTQIKAKGALAMEELAQMDSLERGSLYKALAPMLNIDPNNRKAIEAAISGGKVDSNMGIAAIMKTVTDRSGMALGGLAAKQSHTLGGEFERLLSLPQQLMMRLNSTPLGDALTGALARISDLLRPDGPMAGRMLETLSKLGVKAADWIEKMSKGDTLEKTFNGVLDAIEKIPKIIDAIENGLSRFGTGFMKGFKAFAPDKLGEQKGGVEAFSDAMEVLGRTIGMVAGITTTQIAAIGGAIGTMIENYEKAKNSLTLENLFKALMPDTAFLFGVGKGIIDGLWNGIKNGWDGLLGKLRTITDSIPGQVRAQLGIHSPSTVFEQIGGFTAEGFGQGLEDGMADIRASAGGIFAPPSFTMGDVMAGGGRSSTTTIGAPSVNIEVNSTADAEATGKAVGRSVHDELLRLLEGVQMEIGAANAA